MKRTATIAFFAAAAIAGGLLCGCSSSAVADDGSTMLTHATHTSREDARRSMAWAEYVDREGIAPGSALSDLTEPQVEQLIQTATLYCSVDRGRPRADVGGCSEREIFNTACKLYLHLRYGMVEDRWQRRMNGGFTDEDNRADLLARAELARRIGLEWDALSPRELRVAQKPVVDPDQPLQVASADDPAPTRSADRSMN